MHKSYKYKVFQELSKKQRLYLHIKRFNDIVLAVIALIILGIPMLIIAAVSKALQPHENVVFSQWRVGKDGEKFRMYKFRTLSNVPEYVPATELNTENHMTWWGRFLRMTSLDELMQLFNILKGEMSFIGPRPLIPQEQHIHEERMKYGVYQVRPGLTGLAQIKGRNKLNSHKKTVYDEFYIQHLGPVIDLKIFFISIYKVLKEENI